MTRTQVKICGLTRSADVERAVALGADAVGVVFAPSPRRLRPAAAARILDVVPITVARVGVFADEPTEFVLDAVAECRLDWVQLAGPGDPRTPAFLHARILKTVHVTGASDLASAARGVADAFLLDAPPAAGQRGGTGRSFDWAGAGRLPWPRHRVVVAGGLRPGNVGRAMAMLRPGAVDVSSGVESSPGIKDAELLAAFFAAVTRGDQALHSEQREDDVDAGPFRR
ncbi:MAG TPA: phosphoribosylanthranilate isomerase [Longimicrobiales bacterium]|nr:phosphoribosylanthranilate isomerase [Longimicrobiales bacterium]